MNIFSKNLTLSQTLLTSCANLLQNKTNERNAYNIKRNNKATFR